MVFVLTRSFNLHWKARPTYERISLTDPSTQSETPNPHGDASQNGPDARTGPDAPTGQTEHVPAEPSAVRRGCPFARSQSSEGAAEPVLPVAEVLDPEWGVLRSAIWASAWVAIFSVACYQLFPGGGVVVAALGCGLAMIGLFSSRPIPATVLLVTHAGLFFGCYQRLF